MVLVRTVIEYNENGFLAHVENYCGAYTSGKTRAEALGKRKGEVDSVYKKWLAVVLGVLVMACAAFFGYMYLQGKGEGERVIPVSDLSLVEPGLNLRALHQEGYTGKGINVAIIDGPLLQEHDEYSDRLVHYEEVGVVDDYLYHGTSVASVLVGKKCGVLPEAQLHYFAVNLVDLENALRALERLLTYNETLPSGGKIRYVNLSTGFGGQEAAFRALILKAREQGILVFTSTMPTATEPPLALREAAYDDQQDMNNLNSIVIGEWMDAFLKENNMSREELVQIRQEADDEKGFINVYLPCAKRYVASPEAKDKYVYELDGGLSWATPMLTGLAGMAAQINQGLAIDQILQLLVHSIVTNEKGLNVIDPQLLISLARETLE